MGWLFLAPTIIVVGVLVFYPLIQVVVLSFFDVNPLTLIARPVGWRNYLDLLHDGGFWQALRANLVWVGGGLFLQLVLGVLLALLLDRRLPARGLARALVLFPYLLPTVVTVLIWQWMLNDLYGIVDATLIRLGLAPPDWLGSIPTAMLTVIGIGSWKTFPFVVIAVLARLQSIPPALYEAARVDGASAWARFWDVTVPHLRSVLFVVVLLRAIWDFKEFDLIFLLTGGGPVTSTTTLPLLIYNQAFQLLHLGQAAATAVGMLLVMLGLIFCYFRMLSRAGGMEAAE